MLVNGRTISTSVDKATKFNKYFSEQCTLPKSSLTHPLPRFQYVTNTRLSTVLISPEDVHKILSQLDINKSVGPDGISNHILRLAADSISVPLANIFQQSILSSTHGSVPTSHLFIKRMIDVMLKIIGLYPCSVMFPKFLSDWFTILFINI